MSNVQRINDRFQRNDNVGENDFFRKFRFQFSQILNPGDLPRNNEEFEELYVEDKEFDKALYDFQHNPYSMATCAIGYTGIGKSTSIRHCFSIGIRKSAFIYGKQLICPTFLDAYQITDENRFDLVTRIRTVLTLMKETFPDLVKLLESKEGKEELYQFIRIHTERILEGTDPIDEMNWSRTETIEKKLKVAQERYPYQYFANQLKFFIYKHTDEIKELIIILDDIESLPESFQETAIHSYIKFYECMKNTEFPEQLDYSVKLLIAMRPHTHRRYIASRTGETFGLSMPIIKRHSVPLDKLFDNRFEFYTKRDNKKVGVPESWMICRYVLRTINEQFEGKYMDMISRLCFYNVRGALKWYAVVLSNRFWVQRNSEKEAAFVLSEDKFDFNNVSIIRAVSCQENKVYFDSVNGIVPNIFLTNITEDLSVLSMMVAWYFNRKTEFDSYGTEERTEKLSEVMRFWQETCGDTIAAQVRDVINYLFDIRVLRKSIRNMDDYKARDDHTCLNNESILYISPRGSELLRMLCYDSIYLEMVREAAWRDYDIFTFIDKSSYELRNEHKTEIIFKDLLDYILYLCDQEEDILREIRNRRKTKQFAGVMGSISICTIILQGVEKSMNYTRIMENNIPLTEYHKRTVQRAKNLTRDF